MNQPNCSHASLQSDILTTFTGGLQQDLQLFKITSFSSYRGLQPLWQAATGRPTLQLDQLLQEDTCRAPSSASGPVSLQSDILTSFTGGLQQDLLLFNFTSFSSYRVFFFNWCPLNFLSSNPFTISGT